jgi:preprotein translocase subunit SecF
MVVYMLFSFSGIRKFISPSILASVTVATMLFDILIPAGAYGLLMLFNPTIQIDTVFIIAILTIM